jgi:quinol monooxygenase YgiN
VTELLGIARVKIHDGMGEEFKRLAAQCVETARLKDTGTLQYEIYLNDEQTEAVVVERYRDSQSLVEHGANLGDLMEAILATRSFSGELLGEPTADLKANLAGSPVRVFAPFMSL